MEVSTVSYTAEQQAIIGHREGLAYVVAGAGTGKTFTMTARVQALIESGVRPENILVLTFTNAAAREMIGRVRKSIGQDAKKVTACTYHAFCNILMHRYGIPYRDYTILDSGDDEDLIKFVKANSIYADVKLPRASALKEIYSKRINCRMTYEQILSQPKFEKAKEQIEEIKAFYRILQEYKEAHHLVNYDDMLVHCEAILRSPYGEQVRRQYQYVMVDEAQDTNDIQFGITSLLSGNIMYIGDPEQSIYGFRGADLSLYLSVPSRFKGAKIYTLSHNYRCTQQILDVANSIIEEDDLEFKAILQTGKEYYGERPILYMPWDQDEEALCILKKIMESPKEESNAVIYRNSIMSAKLELELVKNKLEYTKRGGIKFFEMSCIRDMMALFRLITNRHDYLSWFRILQNNRRIGEKRANQIVSDGADPLQNNPFRHQSTKTAVEINAQLAVLEKMLLEAEKADYKRQTELSSDYYIKLLEQNLKILKEKKKISEKTIEAEEAAVNTAKNYIPVLLKLMEEFHSLQEFLDSISLDMAAVPESIAAVGQANEGRKSDDTSSIVLTTIHSAKGLEWDHVYIMDAVDGIFPNRSPGRFASYEEMENAIAEERRCMYVAVTRARQDLTIFCPESVCMYGQWYPGVLSEFLSSALENRKLKLEKEPGNGI